ncbi:MAG: 50S ribosomal protein L6 [Clostridiales bacterium]|jgi:large subunit ribosomal protein L6|nr:50S ribosomal protein L6 [Clostridiales bacterium]
MSRIGNAIINIPAGVTVEAKDNVITVKGPKGTLTQAYDSVITPNIEGAVIRFTRANELGTTKAKHGLYRALCANMIKGVTEGFKKTLIVNGVGWKVAKQGKKVVMNIGFSHPVEIEEIDGIALDCPSQTEITVSGIDKEKVGQFAAMVRGYREPEPYHGYGIRYSDEVIDRKVGKAAGGKG